MSKIKIFSPGQIASAAFLGGPIAGVYCLKKNFDVLDNKLAAKKMLMLGALYSLVLLLIVVFIPSNIGSGLNVANTFVCWRFAHKYQISKKDIVGSVHYEFRSIWQELLVVTLSAIVTIALVGSILIATEQLNASESLIAGTPATVVDATVLKLSTKDLGSLKLKAQNGDAVSQYGLGMAYYTGDLDLQEDQAEAVRWLRKAADQGLAEAQYSLGVSYHEGSGGLPQDDKQASGWWKKSAEQGYVHAQYNLGVCYKNGTGVRQDLDEAKKWLQKASDQGDEDARAEINSLGVGAK